MTALASTAVHLPAGSSPAVSYESLNGKTDYGTPNCLFLYYIPLVPESKKEDLATLQEEIHAWHAYELGRAEELVAKHVKDKSLPKDDSIDARVKRTNYRANVVQRLRDGGEVWAPILDGFNALRKLTIRKADLNAAIHRELLNRYVPPNSSKAQFSIILKIVNLLVAPTPQTEYKFFFTHTRLWYDSMFKALEACISVSSFQIIIEEPQPEQEQETEKVEESIQQEQKDKGGKEPVSKKRKSESQEESIPKKQKSESQKGAIQQKPRDEDKEETKTQKKGKAHEEVIEQKQKANPQEEDLITLRLGFIDYTMRFSRETWKRIRAKLESVDKHYFDEGEKIRKEMSVDFFTTK